MQFIDGITWDDAVDVIGDKSPIGSALNSEEWSQMPLALRDRAFFSSTIEDVRFLQRARDFIADFLAQQTETLPNGKTALKAGGRQQFIRDMSEFAVSEGMGPLDASDAGTLKDIRSEGRLGLIFDTMTQSAHDYTYWKQGQNQDVLDAYPAQRFLREVEVKTPRPVHQANDGVVRLKSDLGFWLAMNDPSFGGFGVPYGPWGFNSGMGVEDMERSEAEGMGLIQPGEKPKSVEEDFNKKLEASTRGLDPDMMDTLRDAFGDQVEFKADTVRWAKRGDDTAPAQPSAVPQPGGAVSAPLQGLTDVLSKLGLDADQVATADDMTALREELKEENPMSAQRVIKYIRGSQPAGALTDAGVESAAQEFLDFVPAATLRRLPALKIDIAGRMGSTLGIYNMGGQMDLSRDLLKNDAERLRRTLFHELMHWVHREGEQTYRDAIGQHFDDRTQGERIKALAGYLNAYGKLDKWYDSYAGRIYDFEKVAGQKPGGLEVPTKYIEWLLKDPQEMAALWNDKYFRETMKVVLQGLF